MSTPRPVRTGLVLFGSLSVLDVFGPLLTDGEHPPMAVAVAGSVLGVASLALLVPAWRGGQRALLGLVGLRVVSALTAVPAFFVAGVPTVVIIAVSVIVTVTLVGTLLVLPAARRRVTAGAR